MVASIGFVLLLWIASQIILMQKPEIDITLLTSVASFLQAHIIELFIGVLLLSYGILLLTTSFTSYGQKS